MRAVGLLVRSNWLAGTSAPQLEWLAETPANPRFVSRPAKPSVMEELRQVRAPIASGGGSGSRAHR